MSLSLVGIAALVVALIFQYVISPALRRKLAGSFKRPSLATAGALGLSDFIASTALLIAFSTALAGIALAAFVRLSISHGESATLDSIAGVIARVERLQALLQNLQFGTVLVVLGLLVAALAYVAWRARRSQFSALIEQEREARFNALLEQAKEGGLPELPPTAEMANVADRMKWIEQAIDALLAKNPPGEDGNVPATAKPEFDRLVEDYGKLRQLLAFMNIERRIEVTIDEDRIQPKAPRSALGKIGSAFISRGMLSTFNGVGKAAFVALMLLLVPASVVAIGATPGVGTQLATTFDQLERIGVDLGAEDASSTWQQALAAAPEAEPEADTTPSADDGWCTGASAECDELILDRLAATFENAYAEGLYSTIQVTPAVGKNFAATAVRTAIMAEAAERVPLTGVGLDYAPSYSPAIDDTFSNKLARLAAEEQLKAANGRAATPLRTSFKEFLRADLKDGRPKAWQALKVKLSAYGQTFAQIPARAAIQQELAIRSLGAFADLAPGNLPGGDAIEQLLREASFHKNSVDIQSRRYAALLLSGESPERAAQQVASSMRGVQGGVRRAELVSVRAIAPQINYAGNAAIELMNDRPPTLLRFEEPHVDLDRLRVATNSYDNAMSQSRGTAPRTVDALAGFDDFFPGWRSASPAGLNGGGGGRLAITEAAIRGAAAVEARGASFGAARWFAGLMGSRRIGGVLIGRNPAAPDTSLDFTDIRWTSDVNGIKLSLTRSDGSIVHLPPEDPEIVHLALVYAAEGRPVTVTMTEAQPFRELKIQLHPALVDTALGCRAIEVDRYVDTYTRDDEAIMTARQAVTDPLALFYLAHAARRRAVAEASMSSFPSPDDQKFLQSVVDQSTATLADPVVREQAEKARQSGTVFDPQLSPLKAKPDYMDPGIVGAMEMCMTRPTVSNLESFEYCIVSNAVLPTEQELILDLLTPAPSYAAWSGVRETDYTIDRELAFAGAGTRSGSPLQFMLQIAFSSPPYFRSFGGSRETWWGEKTPNLDAAIDPDPWQFPVIAEQIDSVVASAVDIDSGRVDELAAMTEFTYLQRLFRAAMELEGSLGPDFPLYKLATLAAETKGAITEERTPRWNARPGDLELALLNQAVQIAQRESSVAPDVEQCLVQVAETTLADFPFLRGLDLSLVMARLSTAPQETWKQYCRFTDDGVGGASAVLADLSGETAAAREMRIAMGVQRDDEVLRTRPERQIGETQCLPMQ